MKAAMTSLFANLLIAEVLRDLGDLCGQKLSLRCHDQTARYANLAKNRAQAKDCPDYALRESIFLATI